MAVVAAGLAADLGTNVGWDHLTSALDLLKRRRPRYAGSVATNTVATPRQGDGWQ
jgi:hypothetical protein